MLVNSFESAALMALTGFCFGFGFAIAGVLVARLFRGKATT